MSFGKKIIAGVAAVATLAALAPAVAMADTAQNQNSATSSQAKEEYATVTFYTADGHSIQGVTWQKGTAFSQYALGIQAPTIEGKTFTGWAYSEGTMLKDTDQVFADIAVYATYADTPTQDDNTQYTVMSYNEHPHNLFVQYHPPVMQPDGSWSAAWEAVPVYPSTPMLLDIAAMQYLYGANMTTRTVFFK